MLEALGLTVEMAVVLALLAFTVFLFVSEIVRVDVAAIVIMVLLGGLAALPGLEALIDIKHLFDGFASNAVVSIIAVMIIGAGLDKTGVMSVVAVWITRYGGQTEARLITMISTTVGVISSFMQNVGAAALFLPVVYRISKRTGLPMSRLLMPMGFCAILGGTMTMVGSSPLILLNDLILGINTTLPAEEHMATFQLFDVAPIGLALIASGIAYFIRSWALCPSGLRCGRWRFGEEPSGVLCQYLRFRQPHLRDRSSRKQQARRFGAGRARGGLPCPDHRHGFSGQDLSGTAPRHGDPDSLPPRGHC